MSDNRNQPNGQWLGLHSDVTSARISIIFQDLHCTGPPGDETVRGVNQGVLVAENLRPCVMGGK